MQIIETLFNIYRPAPEIKDKDEQLDFHKSVKREELMPKI
jgi:hypothetical protein